MKIASIKTTLLYVPYKTPFYWARGTIGGAEVVLVEITTDTGVSGFGESVTAPDGIALKRTIDRAAELMIGRSPYHGRVLMREVYTALFRAQGICSAPRFGSQVLCGLEMALWDVLGKVTNQPVHALLGGSEHKSKKVLNRLMRKRQRRTNNEYLKTYSRGYPR
jgi:D-galactarolactone cycloisomerase